MRVSSSLDRTTALVINTSKKPERSDMKPGFRERATRGSLFVSGSLNALFNVFLHLKPPYRFIHSYVISR